MLLRQTPTDEQLWQSAEEWRQHARVALSETCIRQAIGRCKADRMRRLINGAGVLMIDGHNVQKVPSQNDLYIVPLHDAIPEDFTLSVKQHGKRGTISIGEEIRRGITAFHDYASRDLRVHILGLPVSSPHLRLPVEKQGAVLHELTHADQFNRRRRTVNETDAQTLTRREAEAYDAQFKVVDHHWQYRLSALIAANLEYPTIRRLDIPDPSMHVLLSQSAIAAKALEATVLNTIHGYTPDGYSTAPQELVEDYKRFTLYRQYQDETNQMHVGGIE